MRKSRILVGWREWIAIPELGIPAIKAKVDTGARTSALHATDIKVVKRNNKSYVRFDVHPLPDNPDLVINCEAPVVDRRYVIDSGSKRELRYIIKTMISIGGKVWNVEISLTDRKNMTFRMLLGRTLLRRNTIVDPAISFCCGEFGSKELEIIYKGK